MSGNTVILPCDREFSPDETLGSGQCFRWTHTADGWAGVARGRAVLLSRTEEGVLVRGDNSPDATELWSDYLDLSADYPAMRDEVIALEPRLAAAALRCGGLHILNQEPWEAFCSFIISQNNNIPRIRLIISRLCELAGQPLGDGAFAFPTPEQVSALDEPALTAIGCGYRAGYILAAARTALDGGFDADALRKMPIEDARAALQSIRGVGPKVADCVLLYGLHRLDAFPRDVWIKRALEGEFRQTALPGTRYAGVAQQYIFEYIRAKEQP